MKIILKKMQRMAPWLVLAAVYLLMVGNFALFGAHNLNADDSSEMVLAAQLNEEGKFLSENWLYSTELRVISPVPLYQLGLRLFDSWHAARTFAQAIVMLGIAASVLYLARGLGMKENAPMLAAVFLLPFSFEYAYILLLGCYYSLHLMISLFMLGLVLRVANGEKKHAGFMLVPLAALGLLSGVGGLRMLTMFIVPMAAASCALALLACRGHSTFAQAANEPAVRMAGASLLAAAAAAAGYLVNAGVLSKAYSYLTYDALQMGRVNVSEFENQINGIIRTLGYRDNVPLFSAQGIGCWAALVLTAALFIAPVRLYVRRKELAQQHALLALTAAAAVILGMLLNVFLGQLLVRYFIVGTMLLVTTMFAAIDTEPCKNHLLRRICVWIVVGLFAYLSVCTLRFDFRQGQVNYEMAAEWLMERGYTQGYATFWNANTLTEASDGAIEMWVLADNKSVVTQGEWAQMGMQKTLQHKRHLTEEPEGRVFLLVDELEHQQGSPLLDEAHFVDMIAWSYYVYEYDSAGQMRALLEAQTE